MNIFKLVVSDVTKVFKKIFSEETLRKAQTIGTEIEAAMPQAMQALTVIDKLVPNKTTEEIIALANKYNLHVTPEILADPIQTSTLLENSAVKELAHLDPKLSESALREALAVAYRFFKIDKTAAVPAVTVVAPTTTV